MPAEGGRGAAAVVDVGILVLIGAMSVTAIIKYDTPDETLEIWSATTGLLGVVTGAVVAYFFTRGTVETARQSAQSLEQVATRAQEQEATTKEAREESGRIERENKEAPAVCLSRMEPDLAQRLEQDPVIARALGRRL